MKLSKVPLGPRVSSEIHIGLKRIAAAQGCSLNRLIEEVLLTFVSRHQEGRADVNWEAGIRRLETWTADQFQREEHRHRAAEQRLTQEIKAVRAMILAQIAIITPERQDDYRIATKSIFKQLGIGITTGEPA